jgi:hypothetical protein
MIKASRPSAGTLNTQKQASTLYQALLLIAQIKTPECRWSVRGAVMMRAATKKRLAKYGGYILVIVLCFS